MAADGRVDGRGSSAASMTASRSAVLSSKTRKMVPSAMPAAWAISRVVTAAPCSRKSGRVAATIGRPPLLERQRRRPHPSLDLGHRSRSYHE